jgi:hypothetical protein
MRARIDCWYTARALASAAAFAADAPFEPRRSRVMMMRRTETRGTLEERDAIHRALFSLSL